MADPTLTFITVTDDVTSLDSAFFNAFQTNIVNYVSQFLPLIGGILTGAITWDPSQIFPSSQVSITDPASYAHTGYYNVLDDHINDPIHGSAKVPLPHVETHEIGGNDILYADLIAVSPGLPTSNIFDYFSSLIMAATGITYSGPPPSSRYEIGGADPLYGNLIAIDSSHPSLDIETFVNTTVLAAIGSGYGSNPVFNSVTLSGGILDTSNNSNLSIRCLGIPIVAAINNSDTYIYSSGSNNQVFFGIGTGLGNEYGSISGAGYATGFSIYGPEGSSVYGPHIVNHDLTVTRASDTISPDPTAGLINFGVTSTAYLSYNLDIAAELYCSAIINFGQNVNMVQGSIFSIGDIFYLGNSPFNTLGTGILSDGNNIDIYATDGGNVTLGYSNATLTEIELGPSGSWGSFNETGLTVGTTVLGVSGTSIAGTVNINSGFTEEPGDLGLGRGPQSGTIYFGQGPAIAGYIDYGSLATAAFTFGTQNTSVNDGLVAVIETNGAYNAGGTSTYGPDRATVAGTITSSKAISAAQGTDTTGNAGYAFSGDYTTGMFSAGAGDLRLLLNTAQVLGFIGDTATFNVDVSIPSNILTMQSMHTTATATVDGNLTLGASIITQGSTISSYRVKSLIELGFTSGVASSGFTYKYVPIPQWTGGQIEFFRIATSSVDNRAYPTVFTFYKNNSAIGTLQLGAGQTSGLAIPTVNPTPVSPSDIIHSVCNFAGGASDVAIYMECSQLVY